MTTAGKFNKHIVLFPLLLICVHVQSERVSWFNQMINLQCLTATLSTSNPMQTDSGTNLGLHGERAATNHLNHGMATLSQRMIGE
jgi:hypothetical protein